MAMAETGKSELNVPDRVGNDFEVNTPLPNRHRLQPLKI